MVVWGLCIPSLTLAALAFALASASASAFCFSSYAAFALRERAVTVFFSSAISLADFLRLGAGEFDRGRSGMTGVGASVGRKFW